MTNASYTQSEFPMKKVRRNFFIGYSDRVWAPSDFFRRSLEIEHVYSFPMEKKSDRLCGIPTEKKTRMLRIKLTHARKH